MAEEKRVTETTETDTETKSHWNKPTSPSEGEYKKTTTKVERKEESEDKPTIVVHEED